MRAPMTPSALLLIAALTGCNNMVGTADPPYPLPEDPNPFTYRTVDYPFVVRYAATTQTPAPGEMTRLQAFLKAADARPGDKVTVSASGAPLGQARGAQLRDVMKRAGLDPVAGVDVNLAPDTVSVVLEETVVVPPNCGKWPVIAGDQPSNAPMMNLGCALHNNIYQMVVDKRDLAVGQTPGPADAEPGMRAVQKYREGTSDKKGAGQSGDNSDNTGNTAAGSATSAANVAAGMASEGGAAPSGGASNGE